MKQYHVIISGATGGIGQEITKLVMRSDSIRRCTLLYRNEEKYTHCFADCKPVPKIEKVLLDMGKTPEKMLSLLSQSDDGADVKLILTASTITPIQKITSLSAEQIALNVNINITSQINLIASVARDAKRLNRNVEIINLNSGAAYRPLSGWSLYSGSKSYLNIFLKTLVKENPNIKVVSYDPGVVDTDMQKTIRDTSDEIFDDVETFRDYKTNSQLNSTQSIAQDIFERYIMNWTAENFEEKYSKK